MNEAELLTGISEMMSKHVENWPSPKKAKTAIALIDKAMAAALAHRTDMLDALRECALQIAQNHGRRLTIDEQIALDNARSVIAKATGQ